MKAIVLKKFQLAKENSNNNKTKFYSDLLTAICEKIKMTQVKTNDITTSMILQQ